MSSPSIRDRLTHHRGEDPTSPTAWRSAPSVPARGGTAGAPQPSPASHTPHRSSRAWREARRSSEQVLRFRRPRSAQYSTTADTPTPLVHREGPRNASDVHPSGLHGFRPGSVRHRSGRFTAGRVPAQRCTTFRSRGSGSSRPSHQGREAGRGEDRKHPDGERGTDQRRWEHPAGRKHGREPCADPA